MAAHPAPPFSLDQVAWLRAEFMPRQGAHDCCSKCSGLRCLALPRCTKTDCPLREPVEMERAA